MAWVKLFPDGRNGFGEDQPVPITTLHYFQARVMSNDRLFQMNTYLLYALSTVELHKAQQNVSVCRHLHQNGVEPNNAVSRSRKIGALGENRERRPKKFFTLFIFNLYDISARWKYFTE